MVFHGDYEVEFEIYEVGEGEAHGKLLGHMAAVDAYDAKTRWVENYEISDERYHQIYAMFPTKEWK
mgnify:FL=1|jgi:hypothetical protein